MAARRWLETNSHHWSEWDAEALAQHKRGQRVSVVLPALDEEDTVGGIVRELLLLRDQTGLVDDVIVVDSGSADETVAVAAAAGAEVHRARDVLPDCGDRPGKGEVMWKSLAVARGDVVVFVDADLLDFRPHYVVGLLGPILTDPGTVFVKAHYDRPLLDVSASGGGRVTELLARPVLNTFFPDLAGVVQPLAGEYAARRDVLAGVPFDAGYGVDVGLLLDVAAAHGLDAIRQVDLGHRSHGHQDTLALGRMAFEVLQSVLRRVDGCAPDGSVLTQFRRAGEALDVLVHERPPAPRPPMRDALDAAG